MRYQCNSHCIRTLKCQANEGLVNFFNTWACSLGSLSGSCDGSRIIQSELNNIGRTQRLIRSFHCAIPRMNKWTRASSMESSRVSCDTGFGWKVVCLAVPQELSRVE